MYNIRLATIEELYQLVELDNIANNTPWSYNDYYTSYLNNNNYIYVIDDGINICACCVFGILVFDAEILQLWVSNRYQNRGLADMLLKNIIDVLHKKFLVEKIFLELHKSNIIARKLYLKNNFNIIANRQNYYNINGILSDCIVMVRKL
jgi:ribosomal protein S18 acetylase RimI-like enzyme